MVFQRTLLLIVFLSIDYKDEAGQIIFQLQILTMTIEIHSRKAMKKQLF